MPLYEYVCTSCGAGFERLAPLARRHESAPCPACGEAAGERAVLTPPALSTLSAAARQAHAVNERSRHEPRSSARHGMSCMCCKPGRAGGGEAQPKAFPNSRPWMISH
ncbi:zinc ribbon domain-containing protein [Verticiella sediminum]|uniref:Zinc ribbon domain-containing protein n=1 Tax=Verticiella sediminum TaxID=1247510 RepID=A0A556ABZ9_9BURK|nr:zinc ribbon domain-containing protein [Verticiella sediminum]TSH90415.1 zinc ribbon domain-containing protein [Verticiella sediminum]